MLSTLKRTAKVLLITVIAVLFLAFAVDNRQFVSISLFPLPYTVSLPQFLLAIFCFALGAIAGGLSIGLKLSRARRAARSEHKRAQALQGEVEALQAQPGKVPSPATGDARSFPLPRAGEG